MGVTAWKSEITMEDYKVIAEIRRSDFILEHWRREFPNVAHLEWEEISNLISRSEALQDWYFKKLESMKVLVEMPAWARDVMAVSDFDKVRNDLKNYSEGLKELSRKISDVAKRRNQEVKDLRTAFETKWESTVSDPLIFIFTLNSSRLPIKILMEIESYVQTSDKALTKPQFARHKLDSFKRKLFDLHSQGVNIFDYVKDEALKF